MTVRLVHHCCLLFLKASLIIRVNIAVCEQMYALSATAFKVSIFQCDRENMAGLSVTGHASIAEQAAPRASGTRSAPHFTVVGAYRSRLTSPLPPHSTGDSLGPHATTDYPLRLKKVTYASGGLNSAPPSPPPSPTLLPPR
uniref:Secreted protein n=1 Tax=Mesocestoides corti TaxID=53468 RepID=A0A5K3FXB0_MESCO